MVVAPAAVARAGVLAVARVAGRVAAGSEAERTSKVVKVKGVVATSEVKEVMATCGVRGRGW